MMYPTPFKEYCTSMEHRLTSLRKSILYILWQTDRPLKAYEILDHLLQSKNNSKPTTVYRVLDYFVTCGMVHKVESIQSYTLCCEPKKHQSSELLMVCSQCHGVHEVYDLALRDLLKKLSEPYGFSLGQDAIELKGFCKTCRQVPPNLSH